MVMAVDVFIGISLAIFGCIFGSFAGAQVWRLRARQLRTDDQSLEWLNGQEELTDDQQREKEWLRKESQERAVERKRLDGVLQPVSTDHSICLHCHHRLAWFDLLPLMSWLSTGGRCRYCKVRIGLFEPVMEIGLAIAFAVSYLLWPFSLTSAIGAVLFVLWLVALVLLAILFAYDYKWFLLPDGIVFSLTGVGVGMSAITVAGADDKLAALTSIGGAVVVLSGLYFFLYHISRRQWVGFGDVKLGLGLALLLADWRLALLALFLANLLGSLVVIPGMIIGRIARKSHVPFGPLLIAGTVVSMLAGERIISLYTSIAF